VRINFTSKTVRVSILFLISILYAIFISLGLSCLLNLFGIAFALSLDGGVASSYPRFIPFCIAVGFVSLVAIILLIIFNVKYSERLGYTRLTFLLQFFISVFTSFFMIKLWELLFDFLHKVF